MSLNSDQEKKSLKNSLKDTANPLEVLECLERVLKHRTPFALYVATADRSNCSWIFDHHTIHRMLGGEYHYKVVFDSLFPTPEEKERGVVFLILRKVGPLYAVRVDVGTIAEIISELYDEL